MQEYTVEIGGMDHTVQLSDEDAKARGLTKGSSTDSDTAETKEAAAPKNKAQAVDTKKG